MSLPPGIFFLAIVIGTISVCALLTVIADFQNYKNLQRRLKKERERNGK